jgi:hypothetical protein
VLLVPLLCIGCGERKATEFDRLPVQLTEEFFAAVANRDAAAAERTMTRLQDRFPDQLFFSVTNRQLRIAACLRTTNELTRQGRLSDARSTVESALKQLGPVPELKEAQELFDTLGDVSLYLAQLPFKTSSKADAALQPVRQRQKPLNHLPAFQDWLRKQEALIERLRQQEIDRELQRLLALYDTRIFRQAPDAAALLSQLSGVAPGNAEATELSRLLQERPDALGNWLQHPDLWTSPCLKSAMEIVLYRDWNRIPVAILDQLSIRRLPADPATQCGVVVRIRAANREANYGRVLAWSERLSRQTTVTTPLAEEGIRAFAGVGEDAGRSPAWTTPFPTLTDYLERLRSRMPEPARP